MRTRNISTAFFAKAGNRDSGHRPFVSHICACVVFLTVSMNGMANPARQDLTLLGNEVKSFLKDFYRTADVERVDIELGTLDPRLSLPACDQPLAMKLNDASQSGGSITVKTSCEGTRSWSIYVPAQVSLFRSMVVASRNLGRGEVLEDSDLMIEVVNTSQLRQGFLIKPEYIVGQELKRSLQKGEAFRTNMLAAPMVIKRGDTVSIEANAGTITVTSTGVAMANGRIGEQIRVKNTQSDRTLSAEVISGGKVRTAI